MIYSLLNISTTTAQDTTYVEVSGHITDIITGDGIANQMVLISLSDGGNTFDYELFTNTSGFYESDLLIGFSQGLINATTIDCLGNPHTQDSIYNPGNLSFIFDFSICSDTLINNECENWFTFETTYNFDFTFFGASFPPADEYFWNFGDGNTGYGQQVSHSYDSIFEEFVLVTLETYTTNPAVGDSCFAISMQEIWVGPDTIAECENFFWFETNDNITFNFNGESIPLPADYWMWDFGDGSTAEGQNVTHTFNPNVTDQFLVELYTITFDSIFGDSCLAISQQWIQVGNQGNCQADFFYEQFDSSSLAIHFVDISTGNITDWFWEFGDGNFSIDPSTANFFPGPGTYQTCLTVSNNDPGMMCSDTICKEVIVDIQFEADFQIILDTISGAMLTYQFYDNSLGQPDSWNWEFGDGSTSTLQNPTFQYAESGTFEVCLNISRNFENGEIYSDSYCQTIEAPNYYNFGGQVFINGFPLNNNNGDTTIVDTGIAYLYKKYNATLIPVDTNIFSSFGYYWFTNIREGDYIIKTGLTENSQNYTTVAPSYHENALFWYDANILQLHDTNYYVNVEMVNLVGLNQGPGNISGFLSISDIDIANLSILGGVEILLLDISDIPLTFTKTDQFGNFSFINIPMGSYKLKAEATGYGTYEVMINLDDNNNSVTGVNLELFMPSVGITDSQQSLLQVGNIYPNPVGEIFNLDIELDKFTELIVEIYTIHGQKISSKNYQLNNGYQVLNFETSLFPKGVYLLTIFNTNNKLLETRKFIK